MAVGIVPGLIVGLREGIEAALVVGIILAYLTKIGQRALHRHVYLGTMAAMGASVVAAALFVALAVEFEGQNEELFEGFAAILAVVVLTSMILWMMKAAKNIRRHVEQRIDILVDRRHAMGLASLAFVAVFREGVETVLFMAGLTATVTTADVIAGVAIGLLAAGFIGYSLFKASWRVNVRRFFQLTGFLLIVIAAGLFAFGVHELQEAGLLPWLGGEVYNLKAAFPDGESNPAGYVLRGLIGYNDNPTELEVAAYLSYWVLTILVYMGIRTGKIEIVSRPLRRVWAILRRRAVRAPAAEPGAE